MSNEPDLLAIADALDRAAGEIRELAKLEGAVTDTDLPPGRILARARNRARLSQKDLAELSDVSVNAIINFERGKTRPRPSTLMALSEHVGLHWEVLQEADDGEA